MLRIYAHSLLITARSSAAVRAALICLIRSRNRIGVGVRTETENKHFTIHSFTTLGLIVNLSLVGITMIVKNTIILNLSSGRSPAVN